MSEINIRSGLALLQMTEINNKIEKRVSKYFLDFEYYLFFEFLVNTKRHSCITYKECFPEGRLDCQTKDTSHYFRTSIIILVKRLLKLILFLVIKIFPINVLNAILSLCKFKQITRIKLLPKNKKLILDSIKKKRQNYNPRIQMIN